ncbi:lysozyme inhibitor LprI family protein [Chitiniphilus shinanonensis]|uniref:lysozyme inhibitor LprI family protein n=1 Tax=Chitiniphilus shinanonensis TaxID=553088 RepID=UPI00302BB3DE
MKRTVAGIGLWLVGGLVWAGSGDGAGIGCDTVRTGARSAARTPVEAAICARPELRKLDERIAGRYRQLQREPKVDGTALRRDQQRWLAQRDACGTTADCLRDRLEERLAEVAAQVWQVQAYQPDQVDEAAMHQLRDAVVAEMERDAEFPLETALKSFALPAPEVTTFRNQPSAEASEAGADGKLLFPTERPEGVTPAEWELLRGDWVDGWEGGDYAYSLMDLDGDGDRDLVVDHYSLDIGWRFVSTWTQSNQRFLRSFTAWDPVGNTAFPQLYMMGSEDGRQQGTWIRLQGRVYAAYRDSLYGVDQIYLLRPLQLLAKVPRLTIDYRYRFSVPRRQVPDNGREAYLLDDARLAALNKAVTPLEQIRRPAGGKHAQVICPIPPETYEGLYYQWESMGVRANEQAVADLAVWQDDTCEIGQLVASFAGYTAKDGLAARLRVSSPGGMELPSYVVTARRVATGVTAELALYMLWQR